MYDDELHPAALRRDGYVVIPGFVPATCVAALRAACDAGCAGIADTPDYWTPRQLLARRALADVVFSAESGRVARGLLGEATVFLPNFTMRRNARTDWHLDAAFVGELGGTGDTPNFLQCAVYLQPNSTEDGGGLDAILGSHRREAFGGRQYVPAEVLRFPQRRLASAAGDLVVWDARLLHRSTPLPAQPRAPKYALHWTLAREPALARPFLEHIRRRALSDHDRASGQDRRYAAICELQFPSDFAPALARDMAGSGIRLASFVEAVGAA